MIFYETCRKDLKGSRIPPQLDNDSGEIASQTQGTLDANPNSLPNSRSFAGADSLTLPTADSVSLDSFGPDHPPPSATPAVGRTAACVPVRASARGTARRPWHGRKARSVSVGEYHGCICYRMLGQDRAIYRVQKEGVPNSKQLVDAISCSIRNCDGSIHRNTYRNTLEPDQSTNVANDQSRRSRSSGPSPWCFDPQRICLIIFN